MKSPMDSHQPPRKPAHLLDDLESIRRLLGQPDQEPPLLTDSLDAQGIPLLCEIVDEAPAPPLPRADRPGAGEAAPGIRGNLSPGSAERARLDGELRSAAQLLLQDVIDDFVPQIEAELRRRLDARLGRLLAQRKR